ncbi:MAG: c-type cytochrome [bacterium]|nr:c-type cytochrome [bacterium]
MIASANLSSWLPQAASTQAQGVDTAFYGVYVAGAFAVILVTGLAVTFVRQFRRRLDDEQGAPGGRANPLLQGLWVLAAVAIAVFAFAAGLPGFLDSNAAPWMAYRVQVGASHEGFRFTYPNGHVADTLHVATGRPVRLDATTADVSHSLLVPALRVNEPILPGRTAQAWFTATMPGTFDLRSGTWGGDTYQSLGTAVVAHAPADFEAWMTRVSDIFAGRTMEQAGELLYGTKGCRACHSLDGSKLVGPSFKDLYGHEFDTREGVRITVDAAYIRESILTPNVSVVAGFEPVMTPYEGKITDKEIEAITAWLRTLSDKGGVPAAADSTGTTTAAAPVQAAMDVAAQDGAQAAAQEGK